jgi:hypothetical protein
MLLVSFIPLALVATASAGVIRTRNELASNDIAGMLAVLDRINTGMSRLGADTKLWQGDRQGADKIMEDGRQIISDLGVGAKFVEHTQVVSTIESLQLVSPMNTLNSLTDQFATSLIQKKPYVENLHLVPETVTLLEHARHGALDLSREVTLKMPALTSWGASPATNIIVDKLDKAIKIFGTAAGASQPASPSSGNPFAQPAPNPPSSGQWGSQLQPASNPYASNTYAQPQPNQWGSQPQSNPNQGQWKSNPRPQPNQNQGQWPNSRS